MIKTELKNVIERNKDVKVCTGEFDISSMAQSCLSHIEKLEWEIDLLKTGKALDSWGREITKEEYYGETKMINIAEILENENNRIEVKNFEQYKLVAPYQSTYRDESEEDMLYTYNELFSGQTIYLSKRNWTSDLEWLLENGSNIIKLEDYK